MKQVYNKLRKSIKYKHQKVAFGILILALITLIFSFVINSDPWNSILQNIFAGLFSGFAVTLIGNYKSKELKNIEIERSFLERVRIAYNLTQEAYRSYTLSKCFGKPEYDDALYELIDHMEAIEKTIDDSNDENQNLIHVFGKKPTEYFDSERGYSFLQQKKRYEQLNKMFASTTDYNEEFRKEADIIVKEILRAHRVLIRALVNHLSSLDDKKTDIELSAL